MILESLVLAAVLAAPADLDALRRELDEVAGRIEVLKARRLAGESVEGELGPLLVRSQELAEELERALPATPAAPAPEPSSDPDRERADELREVAAAIRGQAERLAESLPELETRIAAALREAMAAAPPRLALPHASPAMAVEPSASAAPELAVRSALSALVEQRTRLLAHVRALRVEAARLESEANALDEE